MQDFAQNDWLHDVSRIMDAYGFKLTPFPGNEPWLTKGELAKRCGLEGASFDYALPQPLVDAADARGIDIRGQFVMLYAVECPYGMLWPLTYQALVRGSVFYTLPDEAA